MVHARPLSRGGVSVRQDGNAGVVVSHLGRVGAGLGLDLEPLLSDVGDDLGDVAADSIKLFVFEFIVHDLKITDR